MAAISVTVQSGTVAELCQAKPDRTGLVLTVFENDGAFGFQGVILCDDGDPTFVGNWPTVSGKMCKGMVYQAWNGPLVITGKAAARRWTALASNGSPLVGVLETFDDRAATPTAKPPLTGEGVKV